MSKKSIKLNYIYNVSYQILTLLTPLITTPYLSKILQADGIGKVSFVESIVSYFVLFAGLGTATLGQRDISYVRDNKEKVSKVFWNVVSIRTVGTIACLIVYGIFIVIYRNNILMYLIMSINIFAVMFDVVWLFQGIEEFAKIVGRNVVFKILNVAGIFLFVKQKEDLMIYVILLVTMSIACNISLWFYLPKYIHKPKKEYWQPGVYVKGAMSLFVPTIAIQIYTVLDKTMIGIFSTGDVQNGYYEQSIRISKMVLTLVTSLSAVMIPRIGFYLGQHDNEKVKLYMYKGYRFVWFLGIPLCLGLIGISDNMVPWFFGPGYDEVKILLKVLSLLIIAIGMSNITGLQYMIPKKMQGEYTKTIFLGAFCNFVINLILIPKFYAMGAAIASVVAETVITIAQLVMIRKDLSIVHILKQSGHYLVAGVVMLIVLAIENKIFTASIINTLIMIVTGGIVYFLLLLILRDNFFKDNIDSVLGKLRRHK